jgi:hypothetical protein
MLTIQPTLVSTGASGTKVSVSLGLSTANTPATSGYGTFQFDIRWDPKLATVSASSIRLVGNSAANDVTTFDATQVSNGILSAGGFGNFSGTSPLVTFDYTQTTLTPVNFAVVKESFNSRSYLSSTTASNILQVALNAAGQSITPPPIDAIAPTVATFSPTSGSTLSALDSNLIVTFSETVQKGTGAFELRSGSASGTLIESFDVAGSSRVSLNINTLTIDPTASLQTGTTYYLVMPAGGIKDITGNAFAGTSSYSFITTGTGAADTIPPVLNSWSPSAGTLISALDSNLVATFSETISKKTGTLELHSGSATGPLVESFDLASSTRVSTGGSTLTVDPTANLLPATTYVLLLPAGGVQDAALNALASASSLTFQTNSVNTPVSTSTLVAATDAEKLTPSQLKSLFPNAAAESFTQSKLGPSLVLTADLPDDTSLTKIMSGKTSAASGSLADKATALSVTLPSQVGLDISGPTSTISSDQGKTYFNNLIESIFPTSTASPSDKAYKSSLMGGIASLHKYTSASDLVATRLFVPSGNAAFDNVALKGSANTSDFAVVTMHSLTNAAEVQVDQLSSVMAVGPGRIKVIGDLPTTVVGDMFNQTILGGAGNDVLGSGGGSDVLRGGAGQDTFLLGGAGQVTIDDYTPGDVMKFNVFGVNSLAQLASQVTYAAQNAQGVTFRIGADLTVTLTGLSLSSNYTDAMFAFGA